MICKGTGFPFLIEEHMKPPRQPRGSIFGHKGLENRRQSQIMRLKLIKKPFSDLVSSDNKQGSEIASEVQSPSANSIPGSSGGVANTSGRRISQTANRSMRSGSNRPAVKIRSDIDRAKFFLTQVYGVWFAATLASLDNREPLKDIEVTEILEILYRMSDAQISKDVPLKPDEPIYKACLVLCGKYKRKKVFKKTKNRTTFSFLFFLAQFGAVLCYSFGTVLWCLIKYLRIACNL